MNKRLICFKIILLLSLLAGCVTINNVNNPPNSPEKDQEPSQTESSEKEENQNQNSEEQQTPEQETPTTPDTRESEDHEKSEVDERAQEAQGIVDKILNTYQTTSTDILLREGSGIEYSSLQFVSAGSEVYVDGYAYGTPTYEVWLKVEYNSTEGWIPYKAINFDYYPEIDGLSDEEKEQRASEIVDEVYETYQTISTDIILRENDGIEYSSVEVLSAGSEVYVDGYAYGTPTYEVWLRVIYQPANEEESTEGYIPYQAINLDYYP